MDSPPVLALLRALREAGAEPPASTTKVDLREYFLDADDQGELHTSTAHAVAALAEYFERRSTGRLLRPSRLFLHQNALRLGPMASERGVDLRTMFKGLVRCGSPPERLWPYDAERLTLTPDALLYSYRTPYESAIYVRLDGRRGGGEATLRTVKSYLAAGFPVAFGFAVPNSLEDDGIIPYRPTYDSLIGGQTVLAVGYNDRWLRSSRGALLIRNSWGRNWGEAGYGWLPYAYVEEQLALDFWTLLQPDWVRSGEFDLPLSPSAAVRPGKGVN
ncbi:MAG: C1 family peptidase [Planctomycetaceae bacterium]|nr:C1 family peptidase [Planctomycetaceae bacterium]